MKTIDSVSGASLNIIQAALPKLEEKGLKREKYVVRVFEQEVVVFLVVFDDPNRPAGQRGNSPNLVGYEVEVSKQARTSCSPRELRAIGARPFNGQGLAVAKSVRAIAIQNRPGSLSRTGPAFVPRSSDWTRTGR